MLLLSLLKKKCLFYYAVYSIIIDIRQTFVLFTHNAFSHPHKLIPKHSHALILLLPTNIAAIYLFNIEFLILLFMHVVGYSKTLCSAQQGSLSTVLLIYNHCYFGSVFFPSNKNCLCRPEHRIFKSDEGK